MVTEQSGSLGLLAASKSTGQKRARSLFPEPCVSRAARPWGRLIQTLSLDAKTLGHQLFASRRSREWGLCLEFSAELGEV